MEFVAFRAKMGAKHGENPLVRPDIVENNVFPSLRTPIVKSSILSVLNPESNMNKCDKCAAVGRTSVGRARQMGRCKRPSAEMPVGRREPGTVTSATGVKGPGDRGCPSPHTR
jgi:hypothetical protein